MEIQVIEEKNNPLLKRREVVFKILHEGQTPSRKSVVERLAATMNSKVGLVIVDSMKPEFGKRETIAYAKIYETDERAKEVENPHILARNTFKQPEAVKEAASEEAS